MKLVCRATKVVNRWHVSRQVEIGKRTIIDHKLSAPYRVGVAYSSIRPRLLLMDDTFVWRHAELQRCFVSHR